MNIAQIFMPNTYAYPQLMYAFDLNLGESQRLKSIFRVYLQ